MTAPNAEILQGLREEMHAYARVDNQLRELNRQIYALRDHRDAIADRMTELIKDPAFANVQRLQTADGSAAFKVIRPNEGYKSWSLSKGMLGEYLKQHLGNQQGSECYRFIHETHLATLKNTDYAIKRVDQPE
jgi:hypothetical protein